MNFSDVRDKGNTCFSHPNNLLCEKCYLCSNLKERFNEYHLRTHIVYSSIKGNTSILMTDFSKEWLFGKTLAELQEITVSLGLPKFTAKQIADWIYKKNVLSIDEFSNLSIKARENLKEKYEVGQIESTNVQESKDGTKKYLFPTLGGKFIESAYIPDKDRATLCVSSQSGCKMGCLFCMTGKQGFQSHLSAGEILNQVRSIPEFHKLTNLVYMGMGEPMDNVKNVLASLEILTSDYGYGWSPTRITVSTVGVIPAMKEFLEKSKCHLAVSLHSPFDEERKKIMPIQNAYKISDVVKEIKKWDFSKQRRVSFEYIVFKDFNDTPDHVKELAKLLNGLKCRINLIKFHTIPDVPLIGTDTGSMEHFRDALNAKGITTTIRASRGQDIYAACGLLSTKEQNKKNI